MDKVKELVNMILDFIENYINIIKEFVASFTGDGSDAE